MNCCNQRCKGIKPRQVSVQWPDPQWRPMPYEAHTLHYASGPVPYVEVRQRGDAETTMRLFLGDTYLLDCDRDYEARGATDPQDKLANGPASTQPPLLLELFTDVNPAHRSPGELRLAWNASIADTDPNTEVLNMPLRGEMVGMIHFDSLAGFPAGLTITPQVRFKAPGDVSSQPESPTAFTAAGQYRQLPIGEKGRFASLGLTVGGAYVDRMQIFLDGSGTGGIGTIAIAVVARRYDR